MRQAHPMSLVQTRCLWRGGWRIGVLPIVLMSGGILGCTELTGRQPLPAGTTNPAFYHTPAGAIEMQAAALAALKDAVPGYVIHTGLFTDELQSRDVGASSWIRLNESPRPEDAVNARILPQSGYEGSGSALQSGNTLINEDYSRLQGVRSDIDLALGAIATYDTGTAAVGDPKILRGELFALRGYAEILLANFYCSGVPLSTLDFERDYTYHASSTTAEVYQDAVTQEDSALALADTSTQLQYLARVLKGQALLDLDSAAAAAQVVASVPDGFQYPLAVDFRSSTVFDGPVANKLNDVATVADTEGKNGLPYVAGGDPRTTATVTILPLYRDNGTIYNGAYAPLTFPTKYSYSGTSQFVVAGWIEARLIQAEAALRGVASAQGSWLAQLNVLRQTIGLPALSDPGTDSARIVLLFQERAFWLFLTGHRQGDLRRLLRQYPQWFRDQAQVYPMGTYAGFGITVYGTDVTAPIPASEYINPLFHGCRDRAP